MINTIIFSKDRACQLDLLLRSIKKYFRDWQNHKWNVLYTYTSEDFGRAYNLLISRHPEFAFYKEKSFRTDLLSLLDDSCSYFMFGVDDAVFINEFNIESEEFKDFEASSDILSLQLRMYPGITYCYTTDNSAPVPKFLENKIKWSWKGCSSDCWNYSVSMDFALFRTADICPIIRLLDFASVNWLEAILSSIPWYRSCNLGFEKAIIFNNPINKVQSTNNNRCANICSNYLNEHYLNDELIKLEPFDGILTVSTHQEVSITFEKFKVHNNSLVNFFISPTGFWLKETAHLGHANSVELGEWLVKYFASNKSEYIYDLGCGLGVYLKKLVDSGFNKDYLWGVEADISPHSVFSNILSKDLTEPFAFNTPGNCIFLEVGEHIPSIYTDIVLDNIRRVCNKKLVLSWAVRGQGGLGHINCMNNDEVIDKVSMFGFRFDPVSTKSARSVISDSCCYFKSTLMVFNKL